MYERDNVGKVAKVKELNSDMLDKRTSLSLSRKSLIDNAKNKSP